MYLSKEAKRDLTQKRRPCEDGTERSEDAGLKYGIDVAISQRMPEVSQETGRDKSRFPLLPLEVAPPCGHLDFNPAILVFILASRTVRE